MPIYASCDIPLENDEGRYLNNIDRYIKYDDGLYIGTDPEMPEYKHAVMFEGISCIYSSYFIEYPKYVTISEVRQRQDKVGLARHIAISHFLEIYGAMRMSVAISDCGYNMWERLIKSAPYIYIVEAYLDGREAIKPSTRGMVVTTSREPTTPVYMISNSRMELCG